jgi:hypothetical protein
MKSTKFILSTLIFLSITSCNNQPEKVTENKAPQDSVAIAQEEPGAVNDAAVELQYKAYCNDRYGFCIDYPLEVLYPQGESGSGDGQVFTSSDSEDSLLVYRDFSDMTDPDTKFSLKTEYEQDVARMGSGPGKRDVTYKKLGKDFFVISGYMADKIFYQKTIITHGELATCVLSYRKSEKERYNKISEQVFQSFK